MASSRADPERYLLALALAALLQLRKTSCQRLKAGFILLPFPDTKLIPKNPLA